MEIKENIFTENKRLTEVTGDISLVTELRIVNISKKKKKRVFRQNAQMTRQFSTLF